MGKKVFTTDPPSGAALWRMEEHRSHKARWIHRAESPKDNSPGQSESASDALGYRPNKQTKPCKGGRTLAKCQVFRYSLRMATTITEIFRDGETHHRLSLFDLADLKSIEAGLFEKNGKPYLKCLATDKDRPAKPEEIVRQLWIKRLLNQYGYPKSRLTAEFPIAFGSEAKRADIVVFDKDRPDVIYNPILHRPTYAACQSRVSRSWSRESTGWFSNQ